MSLSRPCVPPKNENGINEYIAENFMFETYAVILNQIETTYTKWNKKGFVKKFAGAGKYNDTGYQDNLCSYKENVLLKMTVVVLDQGVANFKLSKAMLDTLDEIETKTIHVSVKLYKALDTLKDIQHMPKKIWK